MSRASAELLRAAHAVLFPATAETTLDASLRRFFAAGGRSLLLGETRDEYVARRMGGARVAGETPAGLRALTAEVAELAGRPVLVAADVELGGIERFPHLTAALPTRAEVALLTDAALAERCAATATTLRALGVNVSLAPIVDLLDASNAWLDGRHWGADPALTARLAAVYVEAFERSGIATTVKHFPGHTGLATDPAIEDDAVVPGDRAVAEAALEPFRVAVAAGASCVMTGPGTVVAYDAEHPALLSRAVVDALRTDLGFTGLVISDDLDAAAVLRDRTIGEAAVLAIDAGNDLLMVAASNDLTALATALVDAVESGTVARARLLDAAARVGALATELGGRTSPRR